MMLKSRKLLSVILVVVLAMTCSVSAFAYSNVPETRIGWYIPQTYLDISNPFTDVQPNAQGITGTCYSDFYFDCGNYKKVKIRDYAMTANRAGDYITIQILDKASGNVIDSIQNIATGPNMSFNKTISFNYPNQEFFIRIFINGGTYIQGGYTIQQTI